MPDSTQPAAAGLRTNRNVILYQIEFPVRTSPERLLDYSVSRTRSFLASHTPPVPRTGAAAQPEITGTHVCPVPWSSQHHNDHPVNTFRHISTRA